MSVVGKVLEILVSLLVIVGLFGFLLAIVIAALR